MYRIIGLSIGLAALSGVAMAATPFVPPGGLGAIPGLAVGGAMDTAGVATSGGTPGSAPTAHSLNLSCLPNGFPGGAPNVRNHAQVCIQGVASKYSNNGIFVNGVQQTGPTAYNDNDYMVTLGLDVQAGANNPVGFFDITQGEPGAPQLWAVNTVTQLQPGFTNSAFGYELDFNNNSGFQANSNFGFWATGAGSTPNFAAFKADGDGGSTQWHYGFASFPGVDTADFLSQSNAADSINIGGKHPGSGLKLKAGLFGISAIDLATDPANNVPQIIRWSDQNGGNYGTFSIGVDKTTEADKSTALAFNLPLGSITMRYDGSLFVASPAPSGGVVGAKTFMASGDLQTTNGNVDIAPGRSVVLGVGGTSYAYINGDGIGDAELQAVLFTVAGGQHITGTLNVDSAATVGGLASMTGISAVNDIQTTNGNVDVSPGKAVALGAGGPSPTYLIGDGQGNTTHQGNLNVTGNTSVGDGKSFVFAPAGTNPPCFLFHDDAAAGLVYECGAARLMRIPDNGSAPVVKAAFVVGSP